MDCQNDWKWVDSKVGYVSEILDLDSYLDIILYVRFNIKADANGRLHLLILHWVIAQN